MLQKSSFIFFFFNDTATTEIYTLSLHDALPISRLQGARRDPRDLSARRALPGHGGRAVRDGARDPAPGRAAARPALRPDRKSTRLNSSHLVISYAVFCLKKKKERHNAHSSMISR